MIHMDWTLNLTKQIHYYKHTHEGFIETIEQLKSYNGDFQLCVLKHFVAG